MKSYLKFSILLLLFIGVSSQNSFAQEAEEKPAKEGTNEQRTFGVGISLFNLNFVTVFDYYNSNSIFIPINVGNKVRVEPSFGFSSNRGERLYNPGVGVFLKKNLSKFNILYGVRFNTLINQSTYSGRTRTDKVFQYSPAVGGEYYLNKHFSLGAEIKYNILHAEHEVVTFTSSSALFRFYF